MANTWVRLWLDMPTDPKWRTISRVSGQSISEVMAVFVYLMTDAANATERGRTQVNHEDVATALDVETGVVTAIVDAMQGRVLEADLLRGWNKRQPEREDNSAERSKAWRLEQKKKNAEKQERTQPNATERNETPREDKDTEEIKIKNKPIKIPKVVFAENVTMTDEEHDKLIADNGEAFTAACVAKLSNYKGSTGKHYKSDYKAILTWVIEAVTKTFPNAKEHQNGRQGTFGSAAGTGTKAGAVGKVDGSAKPTGFFAGDFVDKSDQW